MYAHELRIMKPALAGGARVNGFQASVKLLKKKRHVDGRRGATLAACAGMDFDPWNAENQARDSGENRLCIWFSRRPDGRRVKQRCRLGSTRHHG